MGRTIYWMNVSLDMRIGLSADENGAGDWMRIDEPLHLEFNRRARELSMMIQGRRVYEIMEDFWPAAADDPTLPEYLRDYGRIWTQSPKILVSDSRGEAAHNTRIVGGPGAIDDLADIISETDGAIGVGGATLATHLLKRGMLDELLLFVHPALLGTGRFLFDEPVDVMEFDLLENTAFDNGVVMLRYGIRRAGSDAHEPD